MDARLALAALAKRSIDVQYYLLQDDRTGRALLRSLKVAAQRGVRIRVLVDDLYTAGDEALLRGLAASPNVEVRLFNPFASGRAFAATRWLFAAFDFARVNHRMHNKVFIVDGTFAVAGGRNIADEYFFRSEEGNFVDFDLLLAGPAVTELGAVYDRYWNSTRVYPLSSFEAGPVPVAERQARFDASVSSAESTFPPLSDEALDALGQRSVSHDLQRPPMTFLRGQVDVWADDPEKVSGRSELGNDETTVTSHMLGAVGGARRSVVLVSPYFVPSSIGMSAIESARRRGVDVSVLTNSMAATDEVMVSAAYARYRETLLKMGVSISEISASALGRDEAIGPQLGKSKGRMHAKLLVIDSEETFVGSMNLDLRSSRENTELGLFIRSPELAAQVQKLVHGLEATGSFSVRFDDATGRVQWLEKGDEAIDVFDDEPGVDGWTRLKVWMLSPFVGERLL